MLLTTPRRSRALVIAFCALVALLSATSATAGWREWTKGADYDPAVPDPDTWLGRPFAERHTTVDEIFGYVEALAASSDRVRVERMGTSVQGDPLLLMVISDPETDSSPERRDTLLSVVRDPWSHDDDERREAADDLRPAVWIACSVHGDEASGSDAGLLLAYHLAADRSEATRKILRETIVLVGASHNPDGRRRFLQHVRSFGRQKLAADPSPWAAEHWQTWPGGRTNHFLFDLNRDWAFLTQQETRSHVAAFLKWRPQVFVDLHEMGRESSYFFPPPADPINPNVPDGTLEWFETFGRANARAFDARGFDYFVREDFDLFYPGYGDSWPTLQGAVGMTYEQATTRGRALRQRGGHVAGYIDAVHRHFVASHTTVSTAADRADDLVESYADFHDEARRRADDDDREELVFSVGRKGAEAERLAEVLVRQGIEVLRTTEDREVSLRAYDGDDERDVLLPAGSFRVPMDQPAYLLVRSLLDPHTPMDERFLQQERDRLERGLHNRFYDVTAWSLVFSYGVDAYVARRDLDVASVDHDPDVEFAVPVVRTASARLGWVVPYRDNAALEALLALWRGGVVVETVLDAFVHDGVELPRGSFVVKRAANDHVQDLDAVVAGAAASSGSALHALDASWTDAGPSLGSGRAIPLRRPRVGLVTGPGVSPSSVGGLNWLLEDRYGVDFTVLLLSSLRRVDLSEFDALLIPSLDDAHLLPLEALETWVEGGGVLVAVGEGAAAIVEPHADADEPWTTVERVRDLATLGDEDGRLGEFEVGTAPDGIGSPGHLPPERRPLRTPGAIVRLQLDGAHYLTLGEAAVAHAPVLSDRILTPSKTGRTVARIDDDRPRRSGFMWPVMEEALKGQAFLVEEVHGRGRLILFAEDPGFRGTWEGLHRLLLNGLLLGPSLAG